MNIKSRLNKLERNIMPRASDSNQEWRDRMLRQEEMQNLEPAVQEGDFEACIRYCEICEESLVDGIYKYRDMFVEIVECQWGKQVDYDELNLVDIWYHNLKETYNYLKSKALNPEVQKPVLKGCK